MTARFERKPPPEKPLEQWAGEADLRPMELVAKNPKAKPTHGLHIRLNAYELSELTKLADDEDLSLQKLIRKLVRERIERHQTSARKQPR